MQFIRKFKAPPRLIQIGNLLTRAEIDAVREALSDPAVWRDGSESASGRTRAVKNNLQADVACPAIRGVIEKVRRAIMENETVRAAAQPASIGRVMANRYDEGMSYGSHVDAPYIDGGRTDLSFTLFLSDPEDYAGGELLIEWAGGQDRIKLDAGSLVLYQAASVQGVEPVTRGCRIAAFGWINSRVRSATHREILFDLEFALAELARIGAPAALQDKMSNLQNNLLRAFGD